MIKVVFLGYDANQGLLLHFMDWIEAMYAQNAGKIELTVVTLNKEQNPGLLDQLKQVPIENRIIDRHDDLTRLDIFRQAEIVHCHGQRQAMTMLQIKKRDNLKFKIIVTMHAFRHGTWYRPLYINLASLLCLNKIDVLHFVSQLSKTEFYHLNFLFNKKIASIAFPLGCSKERFNTSLPLDHFDFCSELSERTKNIIYLADISPRKNQLWLLENLKDLLQEQNARLWLFGRHDRADGVKRFIREHNLENNVRMPGRIDGKYIPSVLKKMQVAVCISKSETMGHTIMEPMFAGIPVVTFDVGIACSAVRDFTSGFVIKNADERKNFKQALSFLLKNPERASQMGATAKVFAESWLGWDLTARNCIDIYTSMLSK